MAFQSPITIAQAIQKIETNRLLLPAIQREFVWWHTNIEWLFDSLMRDYPINSFLFWRVEGNSKTAFRYYKFLRTYRQYFNTHNEEIETRGLSDFEAVLDGQQRLTSLYIGLKGSFAYKKPNVRKDNTERNIPTRFLYLDLSGALDDEEQEDNRMFNFKFLTEDEVAEDGGIQKWFKVSQIIGLGDNFDFNQFLDKNDYKNNQFAYRSLSKLQNIVHTKGLINYYLETEPDYHKALNIFTRVNMGGQPLKYSDLLMSTTVASWDTLDARKEFNNVVDVVRDLGYSIGYDFILKTYLILHLKDIKFRVSNFNDNNAKDFQSKWPKIKEAIHECFLLINSFGFTESTLTSKNALQPIIYWIYHRDIVNEYRNKVEFKNDRSIIRRWLNLVLLKKIFGGSADSINSTIKGVLEKELVKNITLFPINEIISKLKGTTKDLTVDDEFIDNLLFTQKDDAYAFPILSLLYPEKNLKVNLFHKDHLHPISLFTKENLLSSGIPLTENEFFLNEDYNNSILNLQILDGNENCAKNDVSLITWLGSFASNPDSLLIPNINSNGVPSDLYEFKNFKLFIELRKPILASKLKQAFANTQTSN